MKTPAETQIALFERIQQTGATTHDLARTLHLGLGAIYKRLKGETLLNISEITLLAQQYDLLFDRFLQPERGIVSFVFPALVNPVRQLEQYLSSILDLLTWANRLPGVQFYYSTAETPIFHYLQFPELCAFKLYMWNRMTWELPEWEDQSFNPEIFLENRRLQRLREEIITSYNQLPSMEFWPVSILNNTINAIDYCTESGAFARPGDALLLRRQIVELVQHQKEMAKAGAKFNLGAQPDSSSGAFTLYHNEIAHTSITILLEWDKGRMAFTTFDNPNFMHTSDPEFTRYAAGWFAKLRKRSLMISKEGEKHRDRFFNLLNRHIEFVNGH